MTVGDTDFGLQVGIGFVGRIVMAVFAFAGSIVLGRILGPDGYGTFYFLMAIVLFAHNPINGWATACRKRLTESEFPSGEAIGATVLGIAVGTAITLMSAFLLSPIITRHTDNPDSWVYLTILFVGIISFTASLQILKATKHFGTSTWVEAARDIVRVLLQGSLVIGGFGVAGMVGGITAANLLIVPMVFYLIGARPTVPSKESLLAIWEFARSSIPSGLVGIAQNRMDVLLLGFLVGTEVVGNYEIALKMTMPAMFVAGVAQSGLMGRISNLRSKGEPIVRDIQNNLNYASIIGIPLFFGALTMAEPLVVTIYSNKFAGAAPFLIGLALFRLLRTQKAILVATINGLDRPEINLRISIVVFSVNIGIGVTLLYIIGPLGIVVATIMSELLAYGIRAYYVDSMMPNLSLITRPVYEQLASGVVMAIVVYTARQALPIRFWPMVIVVVGIGGLIYFAMLIIISKSFSTTIRSIITSLDYG